MAKVARDSSCDSPQVLGFSEKRLHCHVEVLNDFGLDIEMTQMLHLQLQVEIKAKLLLLLEVGAADTGCSVLLRNAPNALL